MKCSDTICMHTQLCELPSLRYEQVASSFCMTSKQNLNTSGRERKREKRETSLHSSLFLSKDRKTQKSFIFDGVVEYTFFIIITILREMANYKGVHNSNGGSHKGRPYALIWLIIFGAALLGVMVLHKLRERRIYTLLVKEKDHQILALQLLLQVTNSSQFLSSINPLHPPLFAFLPYFCVSFYRIDT